MYSDVFCKVYNEFGWNYYPEAFGQQLLLWREESAPEITSALDMGCGTGVLCRLLHEGGLRVRGMDLSPGMIAIAREENPGIPFDVGDMTDYDPGEIFQLVTCTGDAMNHIPELAALGRVMDTVNQCLEPGGYFVFDLLDRREVSTSEPFEMEFSPTVQVWFQMTQPDPDSVNLCVRVRENGVPQLEENIRETLHDPNILCAMLEQRGLHVLRCAHRLTDRENDATTWFIIARKGE